MRKISISTSETRKLASKLAGKILKQKNDEAIVVALAGELGSGKTVFTKGFAKAIGVKEHITSPTFVILKNYKLKTKRYKYLIHIDAYRIEKPKEILDLNWKEIVNNPENIILVEWAENITKILPKKHVLVRFSHKSEKSRTIDITHKK